MNDLYWQIPVGLAAGFGAARLLISPYWVWKDMKSQGEAALLRLESIEKEPRIKIDVADIQTREQLKSATENLNKQLSEIAARAEAFEARTVRKIKPVQKRIFLERTEKLQKDCVIVSVFGECNSETREYAAEILSMLTQAGYQCGPELMMEWHSVAQGIHLAEHSKSGKSLSEALMGAGFTVSYDELPKLPKIESRDKTQLPKIEIEDKAHPPLRISVGKKTE